VRDLVAHADHTGCFRLEDDAETMLANMDRAKEASGEA
jgi:hypothetical protein